MIAVSWAGGAVSIAAIAVPAIAIAAPTPSAVFHPRDMYNLHDLSVAESTFRAIASAIIREVGDPVYPVARVLAGSLARSARNRGCCRSDSKSGSLRIQPLLPKPAPSARSSPSSASSSWPRIACTQAAA